MSGGNRINRMDGKPLKPMTLHVDADPEVNRAAQPVLLLHGFTQNSAMWKGVREYLRQPAPGVSPEATGRMAAAAVDLPGHGRSPAPVEAEAYSLESCSEALCATLDQLALSRAWVVGYSMGGRAALHLAVHHPERVAGLVLISTTAGLVEEAERQTRIVSDEALARRIEAEGVEAFMEYWLGQDMLQSLRRLPPAEYAAMRQERLTNRPEGLAGSLRGMGAGRMTPLWRRLESLELPSLVLAGEEDEKYCALARSLARVLSAHLRVLPRLGHSLPTEAPREVAQAIARFLAAQGTGLSTIAP